MSRNGLRKLAGLVSSSLLSGERGGTLADVLIALAILGAFGSIALISMNSSVEVSTLVEAELDENGIARTQMEYTKLYPYAPGTTSYPTIDELAQDNPYAVTLPTGYDINVTAGTPTGISKTGIQLITVQILDNNDDLVLELEGYKTDR